ncbi:hypothetical protein GH808_03760 [Acetobacterium fimetarium]|uniref:AIPR protein n=1 Tax=Acetobacterium fimetarium TaxID=52691 RepID=A0ABR6WSL2_9FIRM|nr:hypothetical protein [Acetobacterium fimetarium]MBC3803552.1 hypothetical protein [Acetobacterium fimetarium]
MEKLFNNRTGVIYQNPILPRNYKRIRSRWLLIPMCEYKVSVPYPKDNDLNLFQMTILKMLVSGSKDDEYLANALCLNTELVAFIVDELEKYQLIDDRRRVTNAGLQIVRGESNSYEIRTGYIYYNYVTKTFMDAFVPDEKHQEIETGSRKEGTISFDLGTVANRKWRKGIVVDADTSMTIEPSAYDVLASCKKHNKRTRNLGFVEEESDGVTTMAEAEEHKNQSDKRDLPWEIQSVKLLGTQKDVYVATYMFMAADDVLNRSKLQVCYPFGEGISASLMESIMRKVSKNNSLKDAVKGLKEEVFGMSDDDLEAVKKGHAASEEKIVNVLSERINDYPAVRDALLSVESSYLLVKELLEVNKGSNREIIKKNLDDYIVYNYNLLASILVYTAKAYDYYTDAELTSHVAQNAVIISEIAKKIGFVDPTGNTFERFFNVKARAVSEAANTSQHQLNALFAHNIITAEHFAEHPFYKLTKAVPKIISYLSILRNLRNDSVHPNDIYRDFEWVSSYRKKNMYIAYLLLDGLLFNNDERESEGDIQDPKSKEKLVKATREAELSCENTYSLYFQRNTYIANQLRNLQFEILLKENEYPKRSSEVFEAIFKQVLSQRLLPDAMINVLDSSKPEKRDELLAEMRAFGFEIEETPFYYKDKVLKTFRDYTNGTLLTLFYAWYYSETKRKDNVLHKLAPRSPGFIKLMSEIHNNRGHDGKMDFNDKRLDYTKKNIDQSINSMLDLMFENGLL